MRGDGRSLVSLLAVALTCSCAAEQSVRGVPRAEWASYHAGGDIFNCRDGSGSIPIAQLNDDYCDCADGSDEPGTSACGQPSSRFYCANRGFRPKYVRSALVGDSVCDCCDGSDEYAHDGLCPNTCAEAGNAARAEAAATLSSVQAGLAIATQWEEQAAKSKGGWESEVATLKMTLAEKQQAATAIEEEKRIAEARESELREAHLKQKEAAEATKKAEEEAMAAATAAEAGEAPTDDVTTDPAAAPDATSADGTAAAGGDLDVDYPAESAHADASPDTAAEGDEDPYPSADGDAYEHPDGYHHDYEGAYTGHDEDDADGEGRPWEEGEEGAMPDDLPEEAPPEDSTAEEALPTDAGSSTSRGASASSSPSPSPSILGGILGTFSTAFSAITSGISRTIFGRSKTDSTAGKAARPFDDFSTPEAEELRKKHREATDAASEVQRQIDDLEKKLGMDYGPNGRFEPLSHECYSSALGGEWTYEICPYKNAAQKGQGGGSTSIGNWEGFADDYMTLKFTNGQMCWNGPMRSLTVSLTCGSESKVLAVDEPEVCKYTMRFQTPAACTQAQAEAAKADADALEPGAMHDEL